MERMAHRRFAPQSKNFGGAVNSAGGFSLNLFKLKPPFPNFY